MNRLIDYVRDLYEREPARVNAAVAAVVMTASLSLGVVLDATLVSAGVGTVLSLLLTGEGTRAVVSSPATVEELTETREIA